MKKTEFTVFETNPTTRRVYIRPASGRAREQMQRQEEANRKALREGPSGSPDDQELYPDEETARRVRANEAADKAGHTGGACPERDD